MDYSHELNDATTTQQFEAWAYNIVQRTFYALLYVDVEGVVKSESIPESNDKEAIFCVALIDACMHLMTTHEVVIRAVADPFLHISS